MTIENHTLSGDSVDDAFIDCPKHGGKLSGPSTLIIHYTGGASAYSSADWLCRSNVSASAHVIIDRVSGTIYQLVPFDTVAWHAGDSSFTFADGTTKSGFNAFSIGIELDNAGPLTKTSAGYQAGFGRVYSEAETLCATHKHHAEPRYWHTYSEVQIAVLRELARLLAATYPIRYVLGHDDVAPSRKIDPGPAFPMESFRTFVLESDRDGSGPDPRDAQTGRVTAHRLNIRSGPSAGEEKVANPLHRNQEVRVVERKDGWYRVRTEIEGWVYGSHVEIEGAP